ncbi:MAG: hypothetical protein LBR33_02875, partial [Propionibacteriaceae bacterium]|nr:hypothetical protein [Propionibacteriaceae bacterium]
NETGQARAFTIVFGDTGYTLKVVQLPRPAAAAAAPAVAAGAQATVTGVGFMPGESVTGTMHSDPLDLGVQVADDNGEVTFIWTIPAGTAAGTHTVELTGDETGTVTTTLDVQGDSLASIMEVIRQLLQRLLDFITQFLAGLGLNR